MEGEKGMGWVSKRERGTERGTEKEREREGEKAEGRGGGGRHAVIGKYQRRARANPMMGLR